MAGVCYVYNSPYRVITVLAIFRHTLNIICNYTEVCHIQGIPSHFSCLRYIFHVNATILVTHNSRDHLHEQSSL